MLPTPHAVEFGLELPWLIFVAYWIVSATRLNKIQTPEPSSERIGRRVSMLAACLLLWANDLPVGVLNERFVSPSLWLFRTGAALTWCGVALAIWARFHLGRYWSGNVVLREEHQLIRSGPYARIRHPIYTGILLGAAGTAVAVGRYRCLVAFLIFLISFVAKSKKEEALLRKQFGKAFEEHQEKTGFFVPRLS